MDVFISFCTKDAQSYANALSIALTARGVQTFQSTKDIKGAFPWEEISKAFYDSKLMALIVTKGTLSSDAQKLEKEAALNSSKRLIPVVSSKLSSTELIPWQFPVVSHNRKKFDEANFDSILPSLLDLILYELKELQIAKSIEGKDAVEIKNKLPALIDDRINKEKIIEFIEQIQKSYAYYATLAKLSAVEPYNETKHKDLEFLQIGTKTQIDKEFFFERDNVDNSMIASEFGRDLGNGEQKFILDAIMNDSETQILNIATVDELIKTVQNKRATEIYMPFARFKEFYEWYDNNVNTIKFLSHSKIDVNGYVINLHWLNNEYPNNKVIILDRSKISIIQKTFEETQITSITPFEDFIGLNKNQRAMVFFGEKDTKDFDIVFKTVLSKPQIELNGAYILQLTNSLKEVNTK